MPVKGRFLICALVRRRRINPTCDVFSMPGNLTHADDDTELLAGEDELLDLILRTEGEMCQLATSLGLTNEDIDRLLTKYASFESSSSKAFSYMLEMVVVYRQFAHLATMIREGETLVPLSELAKRFNPPSGEPS